MKIRAFFPQQCPQEQCPQEQCPQESTGLLTQVVFKTVKALPPVEFVSLIAALIFLSGAQSFISIADELDFDTLGTAEVTEKLLPTLLCFALASLLSGVSLARVAWSQFRKLGFALSCSVVVASIWWLAVMLRLFLGETLRMEAAFPSCVQSDFRLGASLLWFGSIGAVLLFWLRVRGIHFDRGLRRYRVELLITAIIWLATAYALSSKALSLLAPSPISTAVLDDQDERELGLIFFRRLEMIVSIQEGGALFDQLGAITVAEALDHAHYFRNNRRPEKSFLLHALPDVPFSAFRQLLNDLKPALPYTPLHFLVERAPTEYNLWVHLCGVWPIYRTYEWIPFEISREVRGTALVVTASPAGVQLTCAGKQLVPKADDALWQQVQEGEWVTLEIADDVTTSALMNLLDTLLEVDNVSDAEDSRQPLRLNLLMRE